MSLHKAFQNIDKPDYRALFVFGCHSELLGFCRENVDTIATQGGVFTPSKLEARFPSGAVIRFSTDQYPERHRGMEYNYVSFSGIPSDEFKAFINTRLVSHA